MFPNEGVIELTGLRDTNNVNVFPYSSDPNQYPWNPNFPILNFSIKDRSLYKTDAFGNLIYGCYFIKGLDTLVRDDNGRPVRKDVMIPSYLIGSLNMPPENSSDYTRQKFGYFPIPHRKLLDTEDLTYGPAGMGWVIVPKGAVGDEANIQKLIRLVQEIHDKVGA